MMREPCALQGAAYFALRRRNAVNSILIRKLRLCKSAEKNCSRAGSFYSVPAYHNDVNKSDRDIKLLLDEVKGKREEELFAEIRAYFEALSPDVRLSLENFFARYPFWGKLDPKVGEYEEIRLRARLFADHAEDLEWLYGELGDYRSKRTLYAVLSNKLRYDFASLRAVTENLFDEYFDLDLISVSEEEVVVDLGAYLGETVLSYLANFGKNSYKHIYCYEITPESAAKMRRHLAGVREVEIRVKGAADVSGRMRLSPSLASASANTLDTSPSPDSPEVEVVTLDEDVSSPFTMLIADIEGGEYAALKGAARHIAEERPKLLVSVYHGNDDLWRIPRLIRALSPNYKFYLRYKGTPYYPTELTLFAL